MKFGLAFRFTLLLAVIGVLAAGSTGYYAYHVSRGMLVDSAKDELLTATSVLAQRIVQSRKEASSNLQILGGYPDAIAELEHPDRAREQEIATLFSLMMKANPGYYEMRLIAAADHGMERVRIDRDGDRLLRVTGDELQEKGHYPYVYETLKLSAGMTYMSRIAINHEQGAHSGQDRPTVQLATPVVDRQGVTLGVVVINVDLNGMFAMLSADLPKEYLLFMANSNGDYLIHPDPSQTFGFDRGRRILVQDEFPATADVVQGKADHVLIEARAGRYANSPVVAAFIGQVVQVASPEHRIILGLAQPLPAVLAKSDLLGSTTLRMVLAICLVCIVLAVLLARAVTRPLNSMIAIVQNFPDGHRAEGLPVERNDEIGGLARSFNDMRTQISRQMADLKQSRLELEHQAQHDALTGLPNRALFDDRIKKALAAAQRDNTRLAVMFIDVDRFKPINDNLGHAVGDLLLMEFASRIRHAIRDADTAARFGGDEFVILLRNIQDPGDALNVAEKIRLAVNQAFDCEGHMLVVSASIGIALYPEHGADTIELSKHADEAMYQAKEQGRNRVVLFEHPSDTP